jgi:hypothetical protein
VSGVPAGSTSTPTSGTTTTSLPKTPAQFPIAPHQ